MKRMIFLAAAVAVFTTLHAQKNIPASNVPAAAKEAFAKAHPKLVGQWEMEDGDYEVTFVEGGKNKSCVIDKNGNISETEMTIPVIELPALARTYISKHYKGMKVKEASSIVKADGTTMYEARINASDVLFDAVGNLAKTKKDKD
jgi:hypothetical protein